MSFCASPGCWQTDPCPLHGDLSGPPPLAPPLAPPPGPPPGGVSLTAFFTNLKNSLRLGSARTRVTPASAAPAGPNQRQAPNSSTESKRPAPGPVQWGESEFRARLLQQKNRLKDVATEVKHAPLEVQLEGYGPNWTRFLLEENRARAAEFPTASPSPHSDLLQGLRHTNQEGIHVCLIPIPGEVWLLIFRFLLPGEHLRLESTCKDLLTLGYLWDSWPLRIRLSQYEQAVTNHVIASRFACLADSEGEETKGEGSIRYFLNFSDTSVGDAGIRALINVPIENLALNRCHALSDNSFSLHSSVWPRTLKNLGVENCLGLTDGVLEDVGQLHALTSVNLCYVKRVTDEGLKKLSTLTSLRHLDLTHSRIGDNGLHNLVRGATNIEELILSECHRILHLRAVATLPHLRRLELADMAHLSDEFLREGLSTMGTLTSLNLSMCKLTDETLAALANCPGLTSLNLSSCSRITQRGFANLQLPLRSLDLSMLTFHSLPLPPPPPLPAVPLPNPEGPPEAPPLLASSPSLSFQQPPPVSRLAFLANFPTLTNLNLAHCEGILDADLQSLAQLTELTNLSLRHHSKLTDQGAFILHGLPLVELDLTYCSKISDQGLLAFLGDKTSLRSLNVSHCKLLTDDGIAELLKLPNLKALDCSNCIRLTSRFSALKMSL